MQNNQKARTTLGQRIQSAFNFLGLMLEDMHRNDQEGYTPRVEKPKANRL